jgi:hypothetical protein
VNGKYLIVDLVKTSRTICCATNAPKEAVLFTLRIHLRSAATLVLTKRLAVA